MPCVPASARRSRVLPIIGMTLAMMALHRRIWSGRRFAGSCGRKRSHRPHAVRFEIPASWFVGLPALMVLLLAPLQLAVLPTIQRRISTPRMVAIGVVAIAGLCS